MKRGIGFVIATNLILLLSIASIRRKVLKATFTEERSDHTYSTPIVRN